MRHSLSLGPVALTRAGTLIALGAVALALAGLAPLLRPVTISAPSPVASSPSLLFVPNAGQSHPSVQFQAQSRGGTLGFLPAEVVFAPANAADEHMAVRLRYENANQRATAIGLEPQPARISYFRGDDPAAWQAGLPTYAGIGYKQLYDGVDLRFDSVGGRLKSTYTLAPGANPARIRWRYHNAATPRVDPTTGALLIKPLSGAGALVEQAPVAWQVIDGQQTPVPARFHVAGDGAVGFTLGRYNPAVELVIDPTLEWSTYLGGGDFDLAGDVAVDAAGNIYVIGQTNSTNFPTKSPLQGASNGSRDVFVAKYNPVGTTLLYATYLGGSNLDQGYAIKVDSQGNAYIAGETGTPGVGTPFPTTTGAYLRSYSGAVMSFVAKLDPSGGTLVYSTLLGGGGVNTITDLAIDGAGSAYVTGSTSSATFPTLNAAQPTFGGSRDAFVTKLNPGGSALVYSTFLGGTKTENSGGSSRGSIAVAPDGSATITGYTESTDLPTKNAFQPSFGGGVNDAFVARLAPDGGSFVYTTFLGGTSGDSGYAAAVDSQGNAYAAGSTLSPNFPTRDPLPGRIGNGQLFVAKVTPGGALAYSTRMGGVGTASGVQIDVAGRIYLTGRVGPGGGGSVIPLVNPLQASLNGSADAFVTVLDPGGRSVLFSTYLGGSGSENGSSYQGGRITVGPSGSIVVVGETRSVDFPTQNPLQPASGGESDAFVAKIIDPFQPAVAAGNGDSGAPGSYFLFTAGNFLPLVPAVISVNDKNVATVPVDANGVFRFSLYIPPDAPTGSYTIAATQDTGALLAVGPATRARAQSIVLVEANGPVLPDLGVAPVINARPTVYLPMTQR